MKSKKVLICCIAAGLATMSGPLLAGSVGPAVAESQSETLSFSIFPPFGVGDSETLDFQNFPAEIGVRLSNVFAEADAGCFGEDCSISAEIIFAIAGPFPSSNVLISAELGGGEAPLSAFAPNPAFITVTPGDVRLTAYTDGNFQLSCPLLTLGHGHQRRFRRRSDGFRRARAIRVGHDAPRLRGPQLCRLSQGESGKRSDRRLAPPRGHAHV